MVYIRSEGKSVRLWPLCFVSEYVFPLIEWTTFRARDFASRRCGISRTSNLTAAPQYLCEHRLGLVGKLSSRTDLSSSTVYLRVCAEIRHGHECLNQVVDNRFCKALMGHRERTVLRSWGDAAR